MLEKGRFVEDELKIPISAFRAPLSGLEIVVKYLKEDARLSIEEIAELLNRKKSTLYNTYSRSKEKFRARLDLSDNSISIPVELLKNRKFAVLEVITAYLRDEERLSFSQIAGLLGRSESTVRTTYRRYKQKK